MGPQFLQLNLFRVQLAMKTIAVALVGILCAQIFCMPVQQTPASPKIFSGTVIADVADSESFLHAATRGPRTERDNRSGFSRS